MSSDSTLRRPYALRGGRGSFFSAMKKLMGIQLILVCNIILLYVPVHCVSCEIWQEKQTVFQSNRNYTANMAYDFYHIFVIIPLATMEELRRKTKNVT